MISGRRSVAHQDLFYEHVPFRAVAAASLRAGELPLWTPAIRAGYPLHANGEASLLSPFELPQRLLLAPHRATDATFVLGSLAAALLAALLVLQLGGGREAALLGGLGYGLCGQLAVPVFPNASVVAALAPALLLVLERARKDPGRPRFTIAFALLTGCALLAGRPQALVVLAPLVAAYGSLLAIVERSRRLAGVLLLGSLVGFLLGAPQALPTLALVSESSRSGAGLSFEERAKGSLEKEDLALVAVALLAAGQASGDRGHVGVITLALALAGLLHALAKRDRSAAPLVVFALAALLALLYALGPATPFFSLSSLPVLRSLRFPVRFLLLFSLGASLAGALALDRLVKPRGVRVALVLLTALELVVSTWRAQITCYPELYETEPSIVKELRALPRDASGAPARYLVPGLPAFDIPRLGSLGAAPLASIVATQDWANGSRALLYGVEHALGYGEPVPRFQQEFLDHLTDARLDALGVAAIVTRTAKDGLPARGLARRETALPRAIVVRSLDAPPTSATVATIEEATACRVKVKLAAGDAGWLVLPDAWGDGWTARVEGVKGARDERVLRAFECFRAVRIERGTTRVVFDYSPRGWGGGLLLFTSGLLALAVTARRWRSPAGP